MIEIRSDSNIPEFVTDPQPWWRRLLVRLRILKPPKPHRIAYLVQGKLLVHPRTSVLIKFDSELP